MLLSWQVFILEAFTHWFNFLIGTLLPYPDMGATLGIEIFIVFLLAFFEGVRIFLGMYTAHLVPVV